MSHNHERDDKLRINPQIVCTATGLDYFTMRGLKPIASDSDSIQIVPDRIAKARTSGDRMIELEFDPAYAEPSEIDEKMKLIDRSFRQDITFYFIPRQILGVFLN
jgi:hypothetical protein